MLTSRLLGAGGVGGVTATYLETRTSGASGSPFSFTNVAVGSSSAPHHCLVMIEMEGFGEVVADSVTVAGQPCNRLVWASDQIDQFSFMKVFIYITSSEITDTTGTVSVTYIAGQDAVAVSTYALSGLESNAAIDTGSKGTTSSFSDTLSTQDGGVLLVYGAGTGDPVYTHNSPLIEDFDSFITGSDSTIHTGAHIYTEGSSQSFTLGVSSASYAAQCAVSLR